MKNKHLILIGVVVVLALGFFGYRYVKEKDEGQSHLEDTYRRMIEMAQKSPRQGLAEMGMLLQRYHGDNKSYPPSLEALYPKYVSSKSFIEEIDWHYEPKGNDFYLSKTIVRGNQKIIASMDKALRPKMETGMMVASKEEDAGVVAGSGMQSWIATAPVALPRPRGLAEIRDTGERLDMVRRVFMTGSEMVSMDEFDIAAASDHRITLLEPDKLSLVESDKAFLDALDVSSRYLVWKDGGGALGFGNVNYPIVEHMFITRQGKWYSIQRDLSGMHASPGWLEKSVQPKKNVDQIAAGLKEWVLVWKDSVGCMGFGNVTFPNEDRLSISTGESWVHLEKRGTQETNSLAVSASLHTPKALEEVAENLRGQYLVWKDASGAIGFGNVDYPSRPALTVNTTKGWDILKKSLATSRDVPESENKLEKKNREDIASRMGGRYLVWKTRDGALGFGDVEYPDVNGISDIHDAERWKPVTN